MPLPKAGGTMSGAVNMGSQQINALATPSASTDAATKGYVDTALPIGALMMWGAASAPSLWKLCNGASLDRTTYAALFSAIGTTYGSVDGSHFTLPDLQQRFALGKAAAGTGSTLGGTGGFIDHTHGSPLTSGAPSATSTMSGGGTAVASSTHTHSVTIPTANPPFQTVNYIIYAGV